MAAVVLVAILALPSGAAAKPTTVKTTVGIYKKDQSDNLTAEVRSKVKRCERDRKLVLFNGSDSVTLTTDATGSAVFNESVLSENLANKDATLKVAPSAKFGPKAHRRRCAGDSAALYSARRLTAFARFDADTDTSFSGTLISTSARCAKGAEIRLWRDDSGEQEILDTAHTNASGAFSLSISSAAEAGTRWYAFTPVRSVLRAEANGNATLITCNSSVSSSTFF